MQLTAEYIEKEIGNNWHRPYDIDVGKSLLKIRSKDVVADFNKKVDEMETKRKREWSTYFKVQSKVQDDFGQKVFDILKTDPDEKAITKIRDMFETAQDTLQVAEIERTAALNALEEESTWIRKMKKEDEAEPEPLPKRLRSSRE